MVITDEIISDYRSSAQGLSFSDADKWPDAIVSDALCEADTETGGKAWGIYQMICSNFKRRGMYYFASHWLTVTYQDGTAATPSNQTSNVVLNISSKSVGDESLAYRDQAIQRTENDWLSTTNYGVQYLRLRRRATPLVMAV